MLNRLYQYTFLQYFLLLSWARAIHNSYIIIFFIYSTTSLAEDITEQRNRRINMQVFFLCYATSLNIIYRHRDYIKYITRVRLDISNNDGRGDIISNSKNKKKTKIVNLDLLQTDQSIRMCDSNLLLGIFANPKGLQKKKMPAFSNNDSLRKIINNRCSFFILERKLNRRRTKKKVQQSWKTNLIKSSIFVIYHESNFPK